MGTAASTKIPAYCAGCQRDTGTAIELSESAQQLAICVDCRSPKVAGALSAPMAATGTALGVEATRRIPMAAVPQARAAVTDNVVPMPGTARAPDTQRATSNAGISAEDIVAGARASLARLEAEIPALEAELSAKRAHLKGLRKMVAAYDAGAGGVKRRAPIVVPDDPGPPPEEPVAAPRRTRAQARAALTSRTE
jgi:hypothetical protein